eukprot:186110_1
MTAFLFLGLITTTTISATSDIQTIDTEYYGHSAGDNSIAINQGRINSITSWGIMNVKLKHLASTNNAIRKLNWSSDQQTTNIDFGTDVILKWRLIKCSSFVLPKSDYINGYRVIYNSKLVYGLYFYTAKGKNYKCIAKKLQISDYDDTGIIRYDNYYLSGFKVYADAAIDGISFQFTSINGAKDVQSTVKPHDINNDAPTIDTEYYGGVGGINVIAMDQGRINAMIAWDIVYFHNEPDKWTNNALRELSWNSDQQTIKEEFGGHGSSYHRVLCDYFILPKSDYINGYRVVYNSQLVYGLFFYTKKGKNYKCITKKLKVSDFDDTGIVRYDNYYLSGFKVYADDAIDAISFQFTLIDGVEDQQSTIQHHDHDTMTIDTEHYGGTGGINVIAMDQARINAMTAWDIVYYHNQPSKWTNNALRRLSWNSDQQTETDDFGGGGSSYHRTICDYFILPKSDYINGYRVVYNSQLVYGLFFYTKKGKNYKCITKKLKVSDFDDTGIVRYDNYYLSGFKVYADDAIDAISFQFTLIDGVEDQQSTIQHHDHDTMTIDTEHYGGTGGINVIAMDQGRINAMTAWDIVYYHNQPSKWTNNALRRLSWNSDQQTETDDFGGGGSSYHRTICESFVLPKSDYINGYRVIYNSRLVYGLYFYTAKGKNYKCIAKKLQISDYDDTGIIRYDNYYLSGFKVYADAAIDGISFQFTSIDGAKDEQPTVKPHDKVKRKMDKLNAKTDINNKENKDYVSPKANDAAKHTKHNDDAMSSMKYEMGDDQNDMITLLKKYNLEHIWPKLKEGGWNDISFWLHIDENILQNMKIRDSDVVRFKLLQKDLQKQNETITDICITFAKQIYNDNAKVINGAVGTIVTVTCGWIYKRCTN